MLKHLCAISLIMPAVACSQPADPDVVREAAAQVKRDCLGAKSQAPNAAFAHHLVRLCNCTEQKIIALPNHDTQGAIGECYKQLGGVADATDYKATGIQPAGSPSSH